jgi:hypothetical protein
MLTPRELAHLNPVPTLPDQDAAQYLGNVVNVLASHQFGGALIWCFADDDPTLWNRPSFDEQVHERYYGRQGWNGSMKTGMDGVTRRRHDSGTADAVLDWLDIETTDFGMPRTCSSHGFFAGSKTPGRVQWERGSN